MDYLKRIHLGMNHHQKVLLNLDLDELEEVPGDNPPPSSGKTASKGTAIQIPAPPKKSKSSGIESPAMIIVGSVVNLSKKLQWFNAKTQLPTSSPMTINAMQISKIK